MNINLHTLTSYPPSCLNRGFDGHPKTARFGDSLRTRVSSAAVKASWRNADGPFALKSVLESATRSRIVFREAVAEPLIAAGNDPLLVTHATLPWILEICGRSDAAERKAGQVDAADPLISLERGEAVCLTEPELRWLRACIADTVALAATPEDATKLSEEAVKTHRANLKALAANASFETALFGRMATGDVLARTESALWVSHRLSVTRHERIDDSVALVDTLLTPRTGAAALLANQPLVSGMFYGYDILSLPVLTSNLTGRPQRDCRLEMSELAAKTVKSWILTAFNATPKAKRSSTAALTKPGFVMVEIGDGWQHNMVDAFQNAAKDATLRTAVDKLATYIADHDAFMGSPEHNKVKRYFACVDRDVKIPGAERVSISELADICAAALPIASDTSSNVIDLQSANRKPVKTATGKRAARKKVG